MNGDGEGGREWIDGAEGVSETEIGTKAQMEGAMMMGRGQKYRSRQRRRRGRKRRQRRKQQQGRRRQLDVSYLGAWVIQSRPRPTKAQPHPSNQRRKTANATGIQRSRGSTQRHTLNDTHATTHTRPRQVITGGLRAASGNRCDPSRVNTCTIGR